MGYFGIPFRNGVPIGLGSVASFGAQQFDPSSLFIGGTAGTWYDPSDPTTLFTTSTGTTPCAVPGSGSQVLVGLMLDKSQGAPGALGAELITPTANRDFSSNTGYWTPQDGSITISGGAANFSSTTNTFALYAAVSAISASLGKYYEITYTLVSCSAGGIRFGIGANYATSRSAPGTYTERIMAGAGGFFGFYAVGTTTASVDNLSVREIPGNHAIAFNDTTARPELSARVNLLTYSEEFGNAVWTATNSSVTSNAAIAPNGTLTAEKLVENTANSTHQVYQNYASPIANTSLTFSIFAKAAERTVVTLLEPSAVERTFNLLSGVATGSGASMRDIGNGWWQCIATGLAPDTANRSYAIRLNNGSGTTYTGDGTSGIFIWGADLRPANIGSAIPSYQRIADQYTYDSNGFPSYLRFDGVDDSMYTPASINFSGTDKMSVFAGVRKLSDANTGVIASTGTSNGCFEMFAVRAAGGSQTYAFAQRTTTVQEAIAVPPVGVAPDTAVVTGISDIGAPVVQLRRNGTLVVSNSGAMAAGNFGNFALSIGSRGASLRFDGHLYSLITAGTQLQSGSITATEQYVAGKTGVQI